MKNPITSTLRFAALLGAASLSLSAFASDGMVKHADKAFFDKAATSGMEEVAISTGALDRLTNPQIKDFAQMMVTDHNAVNAELTALAAKKGVTLPPKDKDIQSKTEKWSKKTKGVDEDYVKQMISDHEDAVKLFEKASKSDDADVAAFAQKTLPSLQHHLDMAKSLKPMAK
jgi:putative membrane protein